MLLGPASTNTPKPTIAEPVVNRMRDLLEIANWLIVLSLSTDERVAA